MMNTFSKIPHRATVLKAIVFVTCFLAAGARAEEEIINEMTAQRVETLMKSAGQFKSFKEVKKDTYIFEMPDGSSVIVKNNHTDIKIRSAIPVKVTISRINDWNYGPSMFKAYVDPDGTPVLVCDMLVGGVTDRFLNNTLVMYLVALTDFEKYVAK